MQKASLPTKVVVSHTLRMQHLTPWTHEIHGSFQKLNSVVDNEFWPMKLNFGIILLVQDMVISNVTIAIDMLIRLKYSISYTSTWGYSVLYVPGFKATLASNLNMYLQIAVNLYRCVYPYNVLLS